MRIRAVAHCIAICLVAMAPTVSAGIPDDDSLVLYLAFEEGAGDIAMDSSQHAFEARLEGEYDWVDQGRNGGGVEFEAARAIAPDGFDLRRNLIPAIEVLSGTSLPRTWTI